MEYTRYFWYVDLEFNIADKQADKHSLLGLLGIYLKSIFLLILKCADIDHYNHFPEESSREPSLFCLSLPSRLSPLQGTAS